MTIGEKIKEAIESSTIKTDGMAYYLKISQDNLESMYTKDTIQLKHLLIICQKLKIPLAHFLPDDFQDIYAPPSKDNKLKVPEPDLIQEIYIDDSEITNPECLLLNLKINRLEVKMNRSEIKILKQFDKVSDNLIHILRQLNQEPPTPPSN